VGGIYTSSALVSENLITSTTQTLVAAPTAGLGVTLMTLSGDGSKLAYIFMPESNKPELFVYTTNTREHRRIIALPNAALLMGLEWSSDQSSLFIPAGDAILKLDVSSHKLTTLMLPEDIVVGEMSLASDNTAFTSSMSAGAITKNAMQMIKVTNPFDEQQRQITTVHNAEGSTISPAFSPTNPNLYTFSANWSGSWQLWLNDNGQNKQLTKFSEGKEPLNGASWSGDGRYIAFIKGGNLYLYDLRQNQLIVKLENEDAGQPVWLPDNSGILLTRVLDNSQNLWQLDLMSNSMTQLTYGGARHAQFTQSGELLYYRDSNLMRYVDGKRADSKVLDADESASYLTPSLIHNNEQWRFGLLGHIQRRTLTGEVLQQTQLPYQLIGIHFNPHKLNELYLTVFVTPEIALEYIEWQIMD
jgi:WD40 repeat protein